MTNRKLRSRKIRRGTGASPLGSPWGSAGSPDSRAAAPRRQGSSRHAGAQGLWLYGFHAVAAALANPVRRCHRLVATTPAIEALRQRLGAGLGRALNTGHTGSGHTGTDHTGTDHTGTDKTHGGDFDVATASRGEIGALLAEGAVHQGMALNISPLAAVSLDAVCRLETADSASRPPSARRLVVLDRVNDPQNLGAVLRAAAAFDAAAVIVPDRHAPGESGALAKAASGALEVVPLVRVPNLAQAIERLKQEGYWCIGLDGAATDTLARARPTGATALVLGAEGAGLRRLTRERCDALARLPISDRVESLNLAAATAVALYALAVDPGDDSGQP